MKLISLRISVRFFVHNRSSESDRDWIAECVPTCEKSNDLRKVVVQDAEFKDFESQIVCARCHNQCKTTCKGNL